MNGKPRITPIEQQTSVRLGRDQVQRKINSPMTDTMAGIADLAGIMGQAMKERADAKAKYEKQLVLNWEEQLQNKYKELGGKLDQSQDPNEYDGIAAAALKEMKESGKVFLGDKLYKRWENEEGTNYYNSVGIDVENKKQGLYRKKAYEVAKDTAKKIAYNVGYAQTPEEKASALGAFEALIKDNNLSPIEVLSLTETFNRESEIAVLEKTLYSNPSEIATMDKDGKVTSIVDDPNKFNHLTIGEKRAYAERALNIQKARKKGESEQLSALYEWAFQAAETNPEGLQQQVLLFRQNPLTYQKLIEEKLGHEVQAKKLEEMMNWTQTNLLDNPTTRAGVQKQDNFAKMETLYNNFKIQKKAGTAKIKETSLNNVSSLYEVISTFNSGLKISAFNKSDAEKVEGYRNELTRQLGQKIMEADSFDGWFHIDDSGDEMLQKEIKELSQSVGMTVEETAFIYLEARKIAARNNIDLTKDYDDNKEYAKQVEDVFSAARKEYYYKNYGVPRDHVDAFLYDQKIVDLQGQSKSERVEHIKKVIGNAQRYQNEIYKGKKAMLEKDKEGKLKNVFFPPEDK